MPDLLETQSPYQPWTGSAVLLVDLDAFFASVEQLDHPAWRGKPVIVGGDPDKRGVVSTASYEARAFGVRSAMPSSTARQLCPHAIWTRGHFGRYKEVSRAVMEILLAESPLLQQVSIDEAFLDVSPTKVNTEHPVAIARRIQSRIAESGITCSIGVGTSKAVAKIASDMDKPQGLTVVYPGRERDFLSPLPIRTMSGIGAKAEEVLRGHGIETLGQVASAPESLLISLWGKNVGMMRKRCLGIDDAPVRLDDEVKSVSSEISVSHDLKDFAAIAATVDTMAAKVGRRLRKKGLRGGTVSLRMRYSDRSTRSVQRKLDRPENNEYAFLPILHAMIDDLWKPGMAVRLIGVAITDFHDKELRQESLFETDALAEKTAKPAGAARREESFVDAESGRRISAATDIVKNRFGESAVFYGRELHVNENTTGSAAKNPAELPEIEGSAAQARRIPPSFGFSSLVDCDGEKDA